MKWPTLFLLAMLLLLLSLLLSWPGPSLLENVDAACRIRIQQDGNHMQ